MKKNNILVAQSGGPTCAINATLAGVIQNSIKNNYKIYGALNGIEGVLNKKFVDLSSLSEKDTEILITTPAMALGSCRYKLDLENKEKLNRIVEILESHDIETFFYIGGNDSMDTVKKLDIHIKETGKNIKVIGVPKTIDNDLMITDHTPGFGSAAKYISTTIHELSQDLSIYTIPSVTIIEIMGRNAGWLTLSACIPLLLGGQKPDMIFFPEVAFDQDEFINSINESFKKTNNLIIVVSEGIKTKEGIYVGELLGKGSKDNFGHVYLSGAAKYLERLIISKIGCKARAIELNLMQRCASHLASKTDLDESYLIGFEAVNAAMSGKSGIMMIYERLSNNPYKIKIGYENVDKIANFEKKMPMSWTNINDKSIQKEILDYILPLILGETNIVKNENGFQKYFKIGKPL